VARGEISNAITHGTAVFNVLLSHFSSRVTQACISFSLEYVKEFIDQKTGADTKTEVLDLRSDWIEELG